MKTARRLPFLALLFAGAFAAGTGFAQEATGADEPTPPVPESLQTNWWTYFDGAAATIEPRISAFIDDLRSRTAELEPQNQVAAQAILDAVEENFTAYLSLLDDAIQPGPELPEPAATYSLDELLALADSARDARSAADDAAIAVEREQRVLDGVTGRRDAAFRAYVDAPAGDRRFLAALDLFQARSAQAISARRLKLLTDSFELASDHAQASDARLVLAQQRLDTAAGDEALQELEQRVEIAAAAVATAEEQLRAAQIAATGLDLDTIQGRLEQRLQQQVLLEAEVSLALARVAHAKAQAERWWTALQINSDVDLDVLEEQSIRWSELSRDMLQSAPDWQRRSENELLAVQSTERNDLDRASRRVLDQRLATAQNTLALIAQLEAAVADLEIIAAVVDNVVAEYGGTVRSWLTGTSRFLKTSWLRVTDLSNATLFHIGEAPVNGADIVRVVIILIIGLILSRGVRHAIRRVGDTEYSGTQASLYTVGRLTHYAIIILAVFIALSSIGLQFGNLALVAGALSVGIGFGLQSIVNNFVSGLIILFEHSLRVGDYIELDTGLTGTVKAINVRSTLINTNDNIDIVVPNSEFVTARLTNWTLGEGILRVRIPFGVAYGTDKDLVKKAALEAAADVPYTLTHMKGREPDLWLVEYGDNSLNFLLLVWVNRQGARRPTRTKAAYLWALETKLAEYGIEIPFPQRDLHLRSGWPPQREVPDAGPARAPTPAKP